MVDIDKQLEIIKRGSVALCEEAELIEKLKKNKPLRVKLGVDPTAADLHLGFTVVLRKLRQFQDLGHQAILIIGSYTAQVGDPSGRDKTRPILSEDDVLKHAEEYIKQAGKILDLQKLEVKYNGDWFKKMSFIDVIKLLSKTTVARTLERDDFSKRFAAGTPIYLHEMIYPLMQGLDSVKIELMLSLAGLIRLLTVWLEEICNVMTIKNRKFVSQCLCLKVLTACRKCLKVTVIILVFLNRLKKSSGKLCPLAMCLCINILSCLLMFLYLN